MFRLTFFDPDFFLTQIFLDPIFLLLKIFYLIFLDQNIYWTNKNVWTKRVLSPKIIFLINFFYKKFLGPKFSGHKIFFTQIFRTKIVLDPIFFLLKIFDLIFLDRKFFFGQVNLININIFTMLGLLQQCRHDLFVLHNWSQIKLLKSTGCIARLSWTELGTAQP